MSVTFDSFDVLIKDSKLLVDFFPQVSTKQIGDIKIHALRCGLLKFKSSHRDPSIGMPAIVVDPRWTEWLPVYAWVIEHPEGIAVIDTGESALARKKQYYESDGLVGLANRLLTKLDIVEEMEIGNQLKSIGIRPSDVRWVILTHLHKDHTDGLKYFNKSEIIVSRQEFVNPFGAMEATFPKWFIPNLIAYIHDADPIYTDSYVLTKRGDLMIVPTPGHTSGHQSVILKTPKLDFFFAGDATFDVNQLDDEKVAGVCTDKSEARYNIQKIKCYCEYRPTVYLPSHDTRAVERFERETCYVPWFSEG